MKKSVSPAAVETAVPKSPSAVSGRYVFWLLWGLALLGYLDRFMFSGAANVIAKELGFSLDSIGYITSAFTVIYALTALPVGMWADRSKRTRVVATCIAAWSTITFLTALASNFVTLFLSRMFLGIGEAGYYPAGSALLSDYYSSAKRSRIMSWWGSAQFPGTLGGLALGGILAGLFAGGWRLGFLIAGLPGLIMAWLIWRVREPRHNQADEEAADTNFAEQSTSETHPDVSLPKNIRGQLKLLLKIRTLIVLIIVQACGFFAIGILAAFIPTYLQQKDAFGMSSGQAGLYTGLIVAVAGFAGVVAGGYVSGALNRRYASAHVLVCGVGFLLAIPSFLVSLMSHSLLLFTIFFLITVFFLTVYAGPFLAATQDVVPAALRASGLALALLVAHLLGDAFSPSLVGFIATIIDPAHAQHFALGMVGADLRTAMLMCGVPALLIAGLVGIIGTRWMKSDIASAQRINAESAI